MAIGVQKTTAEGVLSWYESQDGISYCIYRGSKEVPGLLADSFTGSEKEIGQDKLSAFLYSVKTEPTDDNQYFLKLYDHSPKSKLNLPGITFQLNSRSIGMYPAPAYQQQNNNELLSRLAAIESKLNDQEEDDEEEDIEGTQDNFLAGIINQPEMQKILLSAVANIAGSFMPSPKLTRVAGINDQDNIKDRIEILLSKGVTIDDIAKLAAMSENELKFLLNMLRK